MGLRDQFQDKAKQLAEQAKARAQGARDEAPARSPQTEQDTKPRADKARDTFDSGFED
ncbi:hypothetical protein ACWGF3_15540 [Streptomyces xanthophaeus]|uniref:Antitoxin n=1 Tax=Streptomyces xanthophaeus TaxID=67385 RepID=A0A919LF70_9ACTN|nr:hypothetical protein [Streptomyces xanthophaeus]WST22964.1 hypothetical protein OG264_16565 [Streptomyces xanthophaeus]WST62060.1 hypothetical protein OG605_21870 [Streptomyces xanthophaeus]GHI89225.1 hypothetical protein Sxan_65890 [Streptomyces xanthophaeus]